MRKGKVRVRVRVRVRGRGDGEWRGENSLVRDTGWWSLVGEGQRDQVRVRDTS